MSVLAIFNTQKPGLEIRKFRDEKEAFNCSNGFNLINSPIELVEKRQIKDKEILTLHNSLADEPVDEFENRYQAACALVRVADEKLGYHVGVGQYDAPASERLASDGKPITRKKRKASKQDATEDSHEESSEEPAPRQKRQRQGPKADKMAGKKIYPTESTVAANPHSKPGAKNYQSIELIRENPGITYEEYVEQGGVVRTLRNAVKLNRVTLSDT